MSDYVRIKAIRCKLCNENDYFKDKDYKDTDDIAEILKINKEWEIKPNELNIKSGLNFETNEYEYFIDFNLFKSYGEEGSDFSFARELTTAEQVKYLNKFIKVIPSIKSTDLRYVDYCYYNGVDEPAVYEVKEV